MSIGPFGDFKKKTPPPPYPYYPELFHFSGRKPNMWRTSGSLTLDEVLINTEKPHRGCTYPSFFWYLSTGDVFICNLMIYQTFFSMVPYLRAVIVSTHQGKTARCSATEMSLWFSRAAMKLCNISEKGVCRKSSQTSKTSSWPTSSDVSWHPMLHPAVSTKCSMAHRSLLTWNLGPLWDEDVAMLFLVTPVAVVEVSEPSDPESGA